MSIQEIEEIEEIDIPETGKCCFCGGEYTMYGNNPDPVCTDPKASCCDKCDWEIVLPALGLNTEGLTYEEMLARRNQECENYSEDEEELIDDEEELYVSCPVVLWDKFILDELRRASDSATGTVKGIIDNMLQFCEYCKENHTY